MGEDARWRSSCSLTTHDRARRARKCAGARRRSKDIRVSLRSGTGVLCDGRASRTGETSKRTQIRRQESPPRRRCLREATTRMSFLTDPSPPAKRSQSPSSIANEANPRSLPLPRAPSVEGRTLMHGNVQRRTGMFSDVREPASRHVAAQNEPNLPPRIAASHPRRPRVGEQVVVTRDDQVGDLVNLPHRLLSRPDVV